MASLLRPLLRRPHPRPRPHPHPPSLSSHAHPLPLPPQSQQHPRARALHTTTRRASYDALDLSPLPTPARRAEQSFRPIPYGSAPAPAPSVFSAPPLSPAPGGPPTSSTSSTTAAAAAADRPYNGIGLVMNVQSTRNNTTITLSRVPHAVGPSVQGILDRAAEAAALRPTPAPAGWGHRDAAAAAAAVDAGEWDRALPPHLGGAHTAESTGPREPLRVVASFSAGVLGFKGAKRESYEAGYQVALRTFKVVEALLDEGDVSLDVKLRGFGQGREATVKALMALEGDRIRPCVRALSDYTPIKKGGNRGKKRRKL